MNTEKFLHYLKIGHGRAFTMLQDAEDKSPYRQAVYDMAVTDVRFDRQTDARRGKYILDLVRCFPDSDLLLSEILECYGNVGLNDDLTGYYISNLYEMASEERGAVEALLKIYDSVYNALKNGRGTDTDPTLEINFEPFIYDTVTHFLIGVDIGFAERIIRDTVHLYDISMITDDTVDTVFYSLSWSLGREAFEKLIAETTEKLPETEKVYAAYLKRHEKKTKYNDPIDPESKKEHEVNSADDLLDYYRKHGRALSYSHSYWKRVSEDDAKRFADIILGYEECDKRALVSIQLRRIWTEKEFIGLLPPFPYDADHLFDFVMNKEERHELHERVYYHSVAVIAGSMKSEKNRLYAIENIKESFTDNDEYDSDHEGHKTTFMIWTIMSNYRSEDAEILLDVAKNISDPYILESFAYHLVNEFFPRREEVNATETELLYYLYENLYCTNCRGKAAEEIVRLGLLTDEIRREIRYDTNKKIQNIDLQ